MSERMPTPRTDAAIELVEPEDPRDMSWDFVEPEFARTLERELATALRERDEAKEKLMACDVDAGSAVAELHDELATLRAELAEARAEIDEIHATGGTSFIRLNKAIAERDEARRNLDTARDALMRIHRAWVFYVNSPNAPIAATAQMDAAIEHGISAATKEGA